jgi:virginiamycin B lyase
MAMSPRQIIGSLLLVLFSQFPLAASGSEVQEFAVPDGAHPHDVAPAADGGVWYTAQHAGALGWLDPASATTRHIPLGSGSSPHGVIVGPDGAAWVTDSGLNAVLRVDPRNQAVRRFAPPPGTPYMNLNTAAFDARGILWFTGQAGYYGSIDPASGEVRVFEAPRGRGPYGISSGADGNIYYASLAGSHIARVDPETGAAEVIEPPTPRQGARRVWGDSQGHIWVSEWNTGRLGRYHTATGQWREWPLPGDRPRAYAVYVDAQDQVWVSDFGGDAIWRFDPVTEAFESITLPSRNAMVRQIHGRPGEVWLPESATDKLALIRTPVE